MTVVPGFTTTSLPSIVAVTNPGFFGGGGAGGPAGFGGAAAGAAGLFSSAIAFSLPLRGPTRVAPLLLDLAGDVVDGVVDGDEVGEEAAARHERQRRQHRPDRRAQPDLVGPAAAVGDEVEPELAVRGLGVRVHLAGRDLDPLHDLL